jgi:hypothetical protein
VSAVASARLAPGLRSRAALRRFLAPDPAAGIEPFIERLDAILADVEPDVVLAGADATHPRCAAYLQLRDPAPLMMRALRFASDSRRRA